MSDLFSPLKVKRLEFANRIVMPPMVRSANFMPPEMLNTGGHVTDLVAEHYVHRARAGTGLIIVEATVVDPGGRTWKDGFELCTDQQIPDMARLAAAIRSAGAIACIQLVHGGPQASPSLTRRGVVGPSAVRSSEGVPLPRELTVEEIRAIEHRFSDAAARAVEAGFQAVELHSAHGYLLDSFLMKSRNHRDDEYGGSMAGRMRMLVETCRLVRQRIGPDILLDCRISLFNKSAGDISRDEFRELVLALEQAGIDLLHISTDGAFKGSFGTQATIGQLAREITSLPLIVCGGLGDPHDAQRLITQNHADFAAIGVGMLRDPDWAQTARQALLGNSASC